MSDYPGIPDYTDYIFKGAAPSFEGDTYRHFNTKSYLFNSTIPCSNLLNYVINLVYLMSCYPINLISFGIKMSVSPFEERLVLRY